MNENVQSITVHGFVKGRNGSTGIVRYQCLTPSQLTYLCPSLLVGHRPSTTPRHHTLFWAALVISDQLVPCCFSSALVSRLQLLRGRPLFLFPCGLQIRAWRVVLDAGFLWMRPSQPHFLRSICLATQPTTTGSFSNYRHKLSRHRVSVSRATATVVQNI